MFSRSRFCGNKLRLEGRSPYKLSLIHIFLYNMARAMVGTCVYASEGKLSPDDIPGLLEGRNRTDAGPTAPPQGLYMTNLWYPVPNLP